MNDSATTAMAAGSERQLNVSFALLGFFWTLLMVTSAIWGYKQSYSGAVAIATRWAANSHAKDVVFRQWAAVHGGAYVPATSETPPNPYLAHLPERDIVTPSGKKLTLMNPAYMTRQVHELGEKRDGLKGHITSLKPIRPGNAADEWEQRALLAFERGEKEVVSLERIGEETYLRLMRPLVMESACLACHARQGYKLGDIRGGLSSSVPWGPSQERVWAQLEGAVLRDGGVWCLGIVGLCLVWWRLGRDLLARRREEKRQAELGRQLRIVNQELTDFAYVVSHDLKAPLRAIKNLADWIRADYQDKFGEEGTENLQLLGSRVDRMQGLIDGILQYSRVGRAERDVGPVDLNQLLSQIVENLGVPGHISVEVQADLPTVEVDATRITQVLQNLLSNAIKYMDKPQGRITVTCIEEDGFWRFSVADNGPGIEEKHFDRIFKLFQTLSSRDERESTGVGLALVKKIVEMYGGRVTVESEMGRGSTFLFTLPKHNERTIHEKHETCAVG